MHYTRACAFSCIVPVGVQLVQALPGHDRVQAQVHDVAARAIGGIPALQPPARPRSVVQQEAMQRGLGRKDPAKIGQTSVMNKQRSGSPEFILRVGPCVPRLASGRVNGTERPAILRNAGEKLGKAHAALCIEPEHSSQDRVDTVRILPDRSTRVPSKTCLP